MCGIWGFYGIEDHHLLQKMGQVLMHRGPDNQGFFSEKGFNLGQNRLSIIDLSDKARQPLSNEDKNIWLIANGEIYNYLPLKKKMAELKHKFRSDTDVEVLLHLYEEYGEEFVNEIEGMFAIAIYDSKKKKLILVRDRLGIKPLYYAQIKDVFLFSSEIKSLLQYELLPRTLDPNGLNNYLTFRYNGGRDTILKSIKKLEPGNLLVLQEHPLKSPKLQIQIKKYWGLNFSIEDRTAGYYAKQLREKLDQSVREHLISDVPVGALLSGGIDSSSIVALMSKYTQPKTFTIGFKGEADNEFEYARLVADKYHTEHKEIIINDHKFKLLPQVIYYQDEPVAGTTSIPAYCIFKEVKKYAKVVLLGDGGDELFAGYEQIKIMKWSRMYQKVIPSFIQKNLVQNFIKLLPKEAAFKALTSYLENLQETPKSYLELTAIFNKLEKSLLLNEQLNNLLKNNHSDYLLIKNYFENSKHYLNQILLTELKLWLPEDILLRNDRMTMAHSIEGRVPFLDHKIVSLAAKMPHYLKLKGLNNEKYILKKAMEPILPPPILKRKKQRFNTPIDHWFDDYKETIESTISNSEVINSLFNREYLANLFNFQNTFSYKFILKRQKLLKQYYARQIWLLLNFAIWHKIFIEKTNYHKIFA